MSNGPDRDPAAEYQRRFDERRGQASALARTDARMSNARLVTFFAGLAAAWLAPAWSVVAIIVLFVALVIWHDRLRRRKALADRAVTLYADGLARLSEEWAGKGNSGARYADEAHPYAGDLDIFGPASLFERLCTTRTSLGEGTLASWLLAAAPPDEVRARQAAVDELRGDIDLREEISLAGDDVARGIDPEQMRAWATEPPARFADWQTRAALTLSALAVPAILLAVPSFFMGLVRLTDPVVAASLYERFPILRWGHFPLLVIMLVEGILAFPVRARVRSTLHGLEEASAELGVLAKILEILESRSFKSPRLDGLRASLTGGISSASAEIGRLRGIVELLDSARNPMFAPFAPLLLWRTQIAMRVAAWRTRNSAHIDGWLRAVGELEALLALSGYAWEMTDHTFPTIVDGPPRFDAKQVGHPLIPPSRRIANDVALGTSAGVLIVSGSNMSGKSTLMRTIGVNIVLALAGAPVCAASLTLTPLRVGASIRINDSLAAGQSRFYAEILRLRQIVDLAKGSGGFLFLLDEILHGTNSHDRRIGAQAVVATLAANGAIGLVSTHDLALAKMTDILGDRVRNVHFEDHMEGDRMVFDYRMREGVVERSNALALMRAVGLDVGT